jgi:hypothetical protein
MGYVLTGLTVFGDTINRGILASGIAGHFGEERLAGTSDCGVFGRSSASRKFKGSSLHLSTTEQIQVGQIKIPTYDIGVEQESGGQPFAAFSF